MPPPWLLGTYVVMSFVFYAAFVLPISKATGDRSAYLVSLQNRMLASFKGKQ